jgi:hypothetical protein
MLQFRGRRFGRERSPAWREAVGRGEKDKETRIGFYSRDNSQFYALKAKRDAISAYLSTQDLPRPLHHLDVVVLDQVILRRLMGLSESFLADENNIHFRHDWSDALSQLQSVLRCRFFHQSDAD